MSVKRSKKKVCLKSKDFNDVPVGLLNICSIRYKKKLLYSVVLVSLEILFSVFFLLGDIPPLPPKRIFLYKNSGIGGYPHLSYSHFGC